MHSISSFCVLTGLFSATVCGSLAASFTVNGIAGTDRSSGCFPALGFTMPSSVHPLPMAGSVIWTLSTLSSDLAMKSLHVSSRY